MCLCVCVCVCVCDFSQKQRDGIDQRHREGCESYLDVIAVYFVTLYSRGALLRLSACH